MSKVGQIERITQDRIVQLFKNTLGYTHLGNWHDRPNNRNIEEDILRPFLVDSGYSPTLINKALFQLSQTANQSKDLYDVNKEVYALLRYGMKIKADVGENTQTIALINWKEPLKNNFAIAEEVSIKGENKKRPDIVVYVNGIALGVLELKRGSVPVSEGIRQNLDNQQNRFIQGFFSTIQLVLAGNDTEGVRYGTTLTGSKEFLTWKEETNPVAEANLLDKHILELCNKKRLLEIIHDFVIFDGGKKKLCRPNQFFGVVAAQKYIRRLEGGIIWHTQGSGKSMTMVWLAKWIKENIDNSRILIVTDRTELDEQIEQVFNGVEENIVRTKSGADLISKLNEATPTLLCSLIHKFGRNEEEATENYIETLKIPHDFKAKGTIIVFIDECHRTQSGLLHKAMKKLLPNALFIGFTGTPLFKEDKKTSKETFGDYIHTYKFDEAIKDGVILDLLYEARDVDQRITDQKGIDEWFEEVTQGMNELPKAELKKQWGTMQKVLSTRSRLDIIVMDIIKDFRLKPRLKTGRGNAMLVARSIFEACRYYELFQLRGFKKCAIITSFEPNAQSTKGESTGEGETEKIEQYEIYQKMLNGKDRETFEKEAKKKFKDQPANMQLLIVVDKLLTGFDAPSCTYLYIDKQMRDHGLFQAICRVNRLGKEELEDPLYKDFGYIIDYQNLFASGKIGDAVRDYTGDAFENFDREDTEGLLNDRYKKGKIRLEESLQAIEYLCEPVPTPKEQEQYNKYFVGDSTDKNDLENTKERRLALYRMTVALIRAYYNIADDMKEAGYAEKEVQSIKEKVNFYTELRNTIKIHSADYIDLKDYEPEMRQMLDMYLMADPSRTLSNFENTSLITLINALGIEEATKRLPNKLKASTSAMAETIDFNMRKAIIQAMPINPAYYEKMSVLLDELIEQRKKGVITFENFLKKAEELSKGMSPETIQEKYPKTVHTQAQRALYDRLAGNEPLTLSLDEAIRYSKKDDWRGNRFKELEIKNVIKKHIEDEDLRITIFELIRNQSEY